jgi:hypothetical protein
MGADVNASNGQDASDYEFVGDIQWVHQGLNYYISDDLHAQHY